MQQMKLMLLNGYKVKVNSLDILILDQMLLFCLQEQNHQVWPEKFQ